MSARLGDVVDALGLAQPSVSKHLRVLREVGLVGRAESSRRR
jgi:DNA-binding transcriptional ArsR family regulator